MLNRFRWMWRAYPFARDEVCCSKTSLNFVDSVFEIFGALCAGVQLVIVPRPVRRDALQLVALLRDHRVSRLILVPSLLRTMLRAYPEGLGRAMPALRLWTVSGEALPMELVGQFFAAVSRDSASGAVALPSVAMHRSLAEQLSRRPHG